jgi:ADP-dependent NAD(P)H-hydrate dehydratase / NAD(P)H-hydrate epimerase
MTHAEPLVLSTPLPPATLAAAPCSLLTRAEATELDRLTIAFGSEGVTLMQRAGAAVVAVIEQHYAPTRCLVLCGGGKNGGDGFIVAELLRQMGWDVACIACGGLPESGDAHIARTRYQGQVLPWNSIAFEEAGLVVDAIFGVGLSRAMESGLAAIVAAVNKSGVPVVAIDMPSGIHADSGAVLGAAVRATQTVTFTRKKPGLLLLPGRDYAGNVIVADINMDMDALYNLPLRFAENAPALWRERLPQFSATQHKYDHGHALILGGGVMTGAARLAARACQRTGAGLVSIAAPPYATLVYASNLDSVLVQPITTPEDWQKQIDDRRKTALLLGPGAGVTDLLQQQVLAALATDKPTVLDADALTCFAETPELLFRAVRPHTVLTPHSGEFLRLFGPQQEFSDRLAVVSRMAQMLQCVVLLKGADTIIAAPDGRAIINANAPPWLATAGSGDVLAGIITGFMAQGVAAFHATCIGAWLHGAAAQNFQPGMIAEDLVATLPQTLATLAAE